MKITIHQSLCGESNKAWSLLKTTFPDDVLAEKIAFNTGLHDQVGDITWLPTVRGFVIDEFFLIMKTYPDKSPDVRPKRVFSHVLMISKEQISSINDIANLFDYFPNEIDKNFSIKPIEFDSKSRSKTIFPEEFQRRFNKVIRGYRKANEFKDTIIWIGEEDFHLAISGFWKILTSAEKATLNFGIYFNTEVIPRQGINFITTPETIENKFINHGYFVVRKNDTQILTDIVEQFIAGDETVKKRITKFQEAIELKKVTRNQLDRIIIGIKPFEEFDTTTDLKRLVSLSHIVAEFSPTEKTGVKFKEKLLHKICLLLENSDINEFLIVRTFAVNSFYNSESKLKSTISSWIDNNLFSQEATKKKNYSALFNLLTQSAISNWWAKHLYERVKSFLRNINSDRAKIIYNWLTVEFNIFLRIQALIDNSTDAENYFSIQLPPNFDKNHFKVLKTFAIKRKWYKFHATLLIAELPFELAIKEQIDIDTDLNSFNGINVLIKSVKPKTIIDAAISSCDKRLIKISGQLCKDDASLLDKIDFEIDIWIEIWLYSILMGNKVGDGFKEPQKKIFKLFDSLIYGKVINEELIEKISETEFANLIDYKNRDKLWTKIPARLLEKFLAGTSSNLLKSLSLNSNTQIPSDAILSDYMAKYAVNDFLYYNSSNIKSALQIFYKFTQLPEKYLTVYINNYTANIDVITATQLGKFIKGKNYTEAASAVFRKTTHHNNWRLVLAECYQLLSIFNHMNIAVTGILKNVSISEDQWWESAEEIIVDLYSNANSLITIWKKAGGKEADLIMNATPRDVWRDVIQNLRQGKFGNINMNSLLKEMKKDYSSNEKFKMIHKLRKNYITF